MGLNTALWGPVLLLATIAFGALEIDRRLSLPKGGTVLEIAAGFTGVFFGLAAGLFLVRTAVGQDLVPWVVSLAPEMRLVVTVAAILCAFAAILAVIPATWSPGMAVTTGTVAAVMLLPSLLPFMVESGATDAVRSIVNAGSELAIALSDKVL